MSITKTATPPPSFYADLGSLNQLKRQANQQDPQALQQVAQQFEQLFLSMLTKSMRAANEHLGSADNPFNSSEVRFYQDMLDSQLTGQIAGQRGIGLADVLVRQLSQQLHVQAHPPEDEDRPNARTVSQAEQLLQRAFDPSGRSLYVPITQGSAAAEAPTGQRLLTTAQAQPARAIDPSLAPWLTVTPHAEQASAAAVPDPFAVTDASFDSPQQFIQALLPIAEHSAARLGVDPRVLVAQAALETGWGRHVIAKPEGGSSFNLFNIKADGRWPGDKVSTDTLEYRQGVALQERAYFRAYQDYQHSFNDYVDFIQNNPRYQAALQAVADPGEYLQQLQAAGYATDPNYAQKIHAIYQQRLATVDGTQPIKEG